MQTESVSAWRLLPFVSIVFLGFLSIALPLPVLSLRVHDELGFSLVTAGWAVGLQALATILTRQMAGVLIDRRGPKLAALMGLPMAVLAGVTYLASAFITDPTASLAVLLLGRVIMGPAESLFLTASMSWGIVTLGARRAGVVMTWQGIAMFLALGIGAPVGLLVMARLGFAGVAAAVVVLPLAGLLVALSQRAVAPAAKGQRASFLGVIGLVWRQGAVLALATAPQPILGSFVALYFASRGWEGAGLCLSGFGIGYILVRLFFAHLPDRLGGRRVASWSLVLEAFGQALLWWAPTAPLALLGATLTGAGFSLIFPSMGVEALRRVPASSQALAIASFNAFLDLSLGLAAPLAGVIVGIGGYPSVFMTGGLGCLLGASLLLGRERPAGPVRAAAD
jgi:MFS family permease